MTNAVSIHSAIRSQLIQQGPCTLGTLLDRLPQFSWSEIFTVVDELTREGVLVLRPSGLPVSEQAPVDPAVPGLPSARPGDGLTSTPPNAADMALI